MFSGFAVVFAEDVPDVPSQVIPPSKVLPVSAFYDSSMRV